ncbi:hypothetical protein ACNHE5_01095 [Pandoraea pnomenusa]|uniref:hypothetical protein n=1 Tax=Pandoraea pnomenusa TaxID=93220 RepID=UPI003CEC6E6B
MRQNEIPDHVEELGADTPRVEACIAQFMRRYPGQSPAAMARYFEAVHQELAPLARELERENQRLRDQLQLMWDQKK